MKTAHRQLSPLLTLLLLLGVAPACNRQTGPQDKGGIYLVIAVKADASQLDQSIERTMAIIRERCDRLGFYCKLERKSGDRRGQFMLRVSSGMDSGRTQNVLLGEGMEMRPVVTQPHPFPFEPYSSKAEAEAKAGTDKDVLPFVGEETEGFVIVERTPIVAGQDISSAKAVSLSDVTNDYVISFALKPEGAARLKAWTGANINNYLAVVLNKKVRTVAYIRSEINDQGEITGRFAKQEAEDTAMMLANGSLPAPIEILEEGTYKP
jgi:preprotein translocase subunit SecD